MKVSAFLLALSTVVMALTLSGCDWFRKGSTRETIFDKVVSIPKELILEIPDLPPLCDEIAGIKKGFIDIKDGKLYFEAEGQGISLVLISGAQGRTHHVFHPYFSQAKNFANIIYYDVRGTGRSSKDVTGKTYTIKQSVEDLESLRKALKIEKWAVLGWSEGGFVAQCYALTYPEHVTGLILIAAENGLTKVELKSCRSPKFEMKAEWDAMQKIYSAAEEGKLTWAQLVYNSSLAGGWKYELYYKPTHEEFVREALYERCFDQGFCSLMFADRRQISLDGKFDDFEVPTLIFEAQWDLKWDTDKAAFMRKNHPHAQVEILQKSGHKLFADEPEKFFKILKSFLEKSSNAHIDYKPGNRLTWPAPFSELHRKVIIAMADFLQQKKENLFLNCYEQAISENDSEWIVWKKLAFYFTIAFNLEKMKSAKNYEKCLTVLQKLEKFNEHAEPGEWQKVGYCVKAWQGIMSDLLGRRDEAIMCYKDALKNSDGRSDNCFPSAFLIDKKWLETNIKSPFAWGASK